MYVTSIICIYKYVSLSLSICNNYICNDVFMTASIHKCCPGQFFGTTSPGFNVGFLVIPHERSGSCIMAIQHGARCDTWFRLSSGQARNLPAVSWTWSARHYLLRLPKQSQTHPNPIFVLPPPDGPTNNFWDVQQWWGCNFQWQYGCKLSLGRLWTSNIVVVESLWKPYNKRSIVCRQAGWIRRNERTIEVRNQNQKIKIFSFYTKSL